MSSAPSIVPVRLVQWPPAVDAAASACLQEKQSIRGHALDGQDLLQGRPSAAGAGKDSEGLFLAAPGSIDSPLGFFLDRGGLCKHGVDLEEVQCAEI